jgi:hypothetical protein
MLKALQRNEEAMEGFEEVISMYDMLIVSILPTNM